MKQYNLERQLKNEMRLISSYSKGVNKYRVEAHKKFSQSCQVPITKILQNGKCLKIAPGEPKIEMEITTGKLIVEGKNLYDSESSFIKERRKFSFEGLVLVSIMTAILFACIFLSWIPFLVFYLVNKKQKKIPHLL